MTTIESIRAITQQLEELNAVNDNFTQWTLVFNTINRLLTAFDEEKDAEHDAAKARFRSDLAAAGSHMLKRNEAHAAFKTYEAELKREYNAVEALIGRINVPRQREHLQARLRELNEIERMHNKIRTLVEKRAPAKTKQFKAETTKRVHGGGPSSMHKGSPKDESSSSSDELDSDSADSDSDDDDTGFIARRFEHMDIRRLTSMVRSLASHGTPLPPGRSTEEDDE